MVLGLARAGAGVVAIAARERQEIERVAAAAKAITGKDSVVPLIADVTREADCHAPSRPRSSASARFTCRQQCRARHEICERAFMTDAARGSGRSRPTPGGMVIDTNVNGPFLMARAAAPHLHRRTDGGASSMSRWRTSTMRRAGFSPYGPSKAALESETIIWSQDLAGTGVTVNALLPGGATPDRHDPGEFSGRRCGPVCSIPT